METPTTIAAISGKGKPSYPTAPCEPCQFPIDKKVIKRLARTGSTQHLFAAADTVEPVPFVVFKCPNKKSFKVYKDTTSNNMIIVSWIWPTEFGRITSFTPMAQKDSDRSYPRYFCPTKRKLAEEVYKSGRIYFCFEFQGKISGCYTGDFSKSLTGGMEALKECYDNNTIELVYQDEKLAFYDLLGLSNNAHWAHQRTKQDMLSYHYGRHFCNSVKKTYDTSEIQSILEGAIPALVGNEPSENSRSAAPHYYDLINFVLEGNVTLEAIISYLEPAITDPRFFDDLIVGLLKISENGSYHPSVFEFVNNSVVLFLRSPAMTNYGTRRHWISSESVRGDAYMIQLNFIDVPTSILAEAYLYWEFQSWLSFNEGLFFDGSEIPLPSGKASDLLENLSIKGSEEEFLDLFTSLCQETMDAKTWSVPWGAKIAIDLPGFEILEIYQLELEFHCIFWTYDKHHMSLVFNPSTFNWVMTQHLIKHAGGGRLSELIGVDESKDPAPEIAINQGAIDALLLICAAIVRDFMVVENRESIFSSKKFPSRIIHPQAEAKAVQVIYLPRVQYHQIMVESYKDLPSEARPTVRHQVTQHLRRVEHASNRQLSIAKRYGLYVPKGYTFVRPHERGLVTMEKQKIYRSRSASAMLFHAIESPPADHTPAWFKFERDMVNLLNSEGLETQHMAANRNGDGGVDIFAYKPDDDSLYAIQCKCYSLNRPVGVQVVRELIGSLSQYPEETVGMIITTSSFTKGAIDLANENNISLVDGDQVNRIADDLKRIH